MTAHATHSHAPAEKPAAKAADAEATAFAAQTAPDEITIFVTAKEAKEKATDKKAVDVDPAIWPKELPKAYKVGEPGHAILLDALTRFGK